MRISANAIGLIAAAVVAVVSGCRFDLPVVEAPPPPIFTTVTAGIGFACGLDEHDALWCWGSNTRHQIDPGDQLQFPLATRIDGRAWEAIDAGGEHTCGISDGQLYCWGRNDHRQVAPISGDIAEPVAVAPVAPPSRWTAVSAGESATCAIGDGRLYCWGNNQYGALGAGAFDADLDEPTPVATSLTDWTAVDIGSNHTCAVSASAGVHCWGYSANGRLGPNAISTLQLPGASARS